MARKSVFLVENSATYLRGFLGSWCLFFRNFLEWLIKLNKFSTEGYFYISVKIKFSFFWSLLLFSIWDWWPCITFTCLLSINSFSIFQHSSSCLVPSMSSQLLLFNTRLPLWKVSHSFPFLLIRCIFYMPPFVQSYIFCSQNGSENVWKKWLKIQCLVVVAHWKPTNL